LSLNRKAIFNSAKLYPILDFDFCQSQRIFLSSLIEYWKNFPDCISFFQLRAKSLSFTEYKNLYSELLQSFPDSKIIVNDFWELGLELNSFGIHIGKEDYLSMSNEEKKKLRSAEHILKGTSSHSIEDLQNLELEIWDYSGFGPIFPTSTKQTLNPVLGVEVLKKALLQTKIPLVPIGGISLENFISLFGFGKILPASISMLSNKKSLVKIVDFIRNHPQPVS
jgi:thiamine-phosphate pyrophosphorylase